MEKLQSKHATKTQSRKKQKGSLLILTCYSDINKSINLAYGYLDLSFCKWQVNPQASEGRQRL